MIIKCDKCSTKFRLDDSRITGNGVKVRCTKCQNVFIVTPPPPAEEVQLEEVFGVGASSRPDDALKKAAAAKSAAKPKEEERRNLAFDFQETGAKEEKKAEETRPDFSSFSEDEFERSFEAAKNEEQPEQQEEPSGGPSFDNIDFSFSEERTEEKEREEGWNAGTDEDLDFNKGEAGTPEKKDEDDFSFDMEEPVESAAARVGAAKGAEALWEENIESVPAAPKAKSVAASGYTRGGKAEEPKSPVAVKEPEDELNGEAPEDFKEILSQNLSREDLPSFSGPDEKDIPVKKERSGNLGLVAAILIIVLGGGFVYYTGVIDKLARTLMPPATSQLKTVEIEAIKGFYEENRNFGKLFVIEARVKNITGEPQEIKAATGIIYNEDGDKIGSRSVSPGRIVTIDDVKNLPLEELQKAFKDPSGGIIPPKGTVPVMVIFTEAEGVAEYGLDIVR